MGASLLKYDDDELVMDIACGQMSYKAIAKKHNLSAASVGNIARGVQRPELQIKINAAAQAILDRIRRVSARLAVTALMRLGKIVGPNSQASEEVQRKAAVDILKFTVGDPSKADITVNSQPVINLPGLSTRTRKIILSELDGPQEDS